MKTLLSLAMLALFAACARMPASQSGLMDVAARPAEKALLAGLRAYDDGHYAQAEQRLREALQAGLASPRDKAAAHKHLAFVYCTSERLLQCEEAFKSARQADRAFALNRAESGHPLWGPVYKRALP